MHPLPPLHDPDLSAKGPQQSRDPERSRAEQTHAFKPSINGSRQCLSLPPSQPSPNPTKTPLNLSEKLLNLTRKWHVCTLFDALLLLLILRTRARAMLLSRLISPFRPHSATRPAAIACAGLATIFLAGCGTGISPEMNTSGANSFAAATGNWKFSTGSTALAGSLTISGSAVTGTLHPLAAACAASPDLLQVAGTIDASGLLTMTSTKLTSGRLSISGTLAADRHSLTNPSITLTGGACATPADRPGSLVAHAVSAASAQQYQPLTGNYTGSFVDSSGTALAVSATLSQPTTPDANGVYHLTGTATFPNTPCLTTPVITDSTVTGDTIQATYTDSQTGGTVVATGTFSSDAQTLTISSWTLSGCDIDTGTGTLTRKPSN